MGEWIQVLNVRLRADEIVAYSTCNSTYAQKYIQFVLKSGKTVNTYSCLSNEMKNHVGKLDDIFLSQKEK